MLQFGSVAGHLGMDLGTTEQQMLTNLDAHIRRAGLEYPDFPQIIEDVRRLRDLNATLLANLPPGFEGQAAELAAEYVRNTRRLLRMSSELVGVAQELYDAKAEEVCLEGEKQRLESEKQRLEGEKQRLEGEKHTSQGE